MIEQVARGIYINQKPETWTSGDPWPRLTDGVRECYRDMARAAIEAMRQPTEEMCECGYVEACKHDSGDDVPSAEIAPAAYQAMIDAALE